ncbi:hypothetical protein K3495_g10330 [Podosphaera aphanis]|nr:hypothetical protein K3495_g10330 [Podosphaera aphanis]
MDEGPTLIRIILNKSSLAHALIDNGCQSYAAIGEAIFKELNLPLIPIPRREVRGASGAMTGAFIQEVTYAEVEINGWQQAGVGSKDECEFTVKSVKYLGFIIRAGMGIQADPDEIRAITEWAPPTTTTGVRSFVGFANYYRMFILHFSEAAAPLTALTTKGVPFRWGNEQQKTFERLKSFFISAPILIQWNYEKATFLEADCSSYALGGALTQSDENGQRKVVAFYLQKLAPAERNYPIHDKEMLAMLAMIRCLEQWDAELRSCSELTILTDHRNLQYFMIRQKLSERQAR